MSKSKFLFRCTLIIVKESSRSREGKKVAAYNVVLNQGTRSPSIDGEITIAVGAESARICDSSLDRIS
jgi:hypothetical protein